MLDVGDQFLLIRLLPAENAQLFAPLVALIFQLDNGLGCIARRTRAVWIEFPLSEIGAESLGSTSQCHLLFAEVDVDLLLQRIEQSLSTPSIYDGGNAAEVRPCLCYPPVPFKQRCNLRCQGRGFCLESSGVGSDRLLLKSLSDCRGGAEEVFHRHVGNL